MAKNIDAAKSTGRYDICGHYFRGGGGRPSRLSDNDVRAIRAAKTAGLAVRVIAKTFGISEIYCRRVALRKAMKHVPDAESAPVVSDDAARELLGVGSPQWEERLKKAFKNFKPLPIETRLSCVLLGSDLREQAALLEFAACLR